MFQEQEEQRRREQSEKEALERWKEEERRKSQQEIGELRQLFLQESKDMASKSSSIEAVSIHWFKNSYFKLSPVDGDRSSGMYICQAANR